MNLMIDSKALRGAIDEIKFIFELISSDLKIPMD